MSGTLKKRGAPAPPGPGVKTPTPLDDENANLRKAPSTPELHLTLRNGDHNGVIMTSSDGHSVTSHDSGSDEAFEVTFTLVLPDGRRQTMTVQNNVQMMDLLVQAAASNKLSPVSHQLLVYDTEHHELEYKPSQTIGHVQPHEIHVVKKNSKRHQESQRDSGKIPFEMTHRLTINLPHGQKMVLRINLATTLSEVFTIVCSEKGLDSFEHELRHPKKLNDELDMTMSLAQYGLTEIKIINIRAPPSRRGSDDLAGSQSMPNLTQVGQETIKKKRGLFGFLKKSKDKKEKRRSMICFDKNNHQTTSGPPSPTSTLQRHSQYIQPPLATVPEVQSPPTAATPHHHHGNNKRGPPVSPSQSAKKRHAPPPPSITRKGGEIVSAEIGPTYQASLGVASDVQAPPSLTNSRRSSVVSAAGVSDSTDFTYNAKQFTSKPEVTSPKKGTPPKQATPPKVVTSPKEATPPKVVASPKEATPPKVLTSPKEATPPKEVTSLGATPPKTPTISPTSTIGRKKRRAPPPPQPVLGVKPAPEVETETDHIPEPEVVHIPEPEVVIETETAHNESIPVEESEVRVQVEVSHSSPILVSKTPPKKPPRPGTPEREIEEDDDDVELRRSRGPCTFTAPPPPAEPPQTVTVGTRMSATPSMGSDITDPRSSVTGAETLDDVTTAFDDVITEAGKDFDATQQQEIEGHWSEGRSTLCSESSSTADAPEIVDRSITPPPDYGAAAEVEISEIGVTLETTEFRRTDVITLETKTLTDDVVDVHDDDDDIIVSRSDVHDDVVSPLDVHDDVIVSRGDVHDDVIVTRGDGDVDVNDDDDDDVLALDDVMNHFDLIESEADDVINEVASSKTENAETVETVFASPELKTHSAKSSPEPTDPVKNSPEPAHSDKSSPEPTDSPRSQKSDSSDKVIILSKSDDLLDFDTIRKRAKAAKERRDSKPRLQKDFADNSPQNTITFKPSTEKEDENLLENKSLILLNKPQKTVTKSIKLDAVELNRKRASSPIHVRMETKVVETKVFESRVKETKGPPEKPSVNESETPKVKYRYKTVNVNPATSGKANDAPSPSLAPFPSPSVGNLRKQFSVDSIGSSFNKEVRIISKTDSNGTTNTSATMDNAALSRREVPVQTKAKVRPMTIHVESDGAPSFGFAPKSKEEIPTSLDGKSKQELKGKLAELHMQFGEMQKQFQQNQALLAKQKVDQGVSRMEPGSPSTVKLGRVVSSSPSTPTTNASPPTPSMTPAPPPPPGVPGAPPPPPPIGFQVKRTTTASGSQQSPAPSSVGQSKKSIRPVSQSDDRGDLMEAIRSKGGRSGLRKVAAKETNWAMTVS